LLTGVYFVGVYFGVYFASISIGVYFGVYFRLFRFVAQFCRFTDGASERAQSGEAR
jgi:MFS superfamily sulfate permease-like transporter